MQQGVSAYARVAQATQSPRELEADVLMRAATRLQTIHDDWENRQGDLDEALTYNRKLWTVLVSSVSQPDNPLPHQIKENILNLGLFIFNHTIATMIEPAASKLGVLVIINRELAAGLRGSVPTPAEPDAA